MSDFIISHPDGYWHRDLDVDNCPRCRPHQVWPVLASMAAEPRPERRPLGQQIARAEQLADLDQRVARTRGRNSDEFTVVQRPDGTWREVG